MQQKSNNAATAHIPAKSSLASLRCFAELVTKPYQAYLLPSEECSKTSSPSSSQPVENYLLDSIDSLRA